MFLSFKGNERRGRAAVASPRQRRVSPAPRTVPTPHAQQADPARPGRGQHQPRGPPGARQLQAPDHVLRQRPPSPSKAPAAARAGQEEQ